jgi:hypothetical protein
MDVGARIRGRCTCSGGMFEQVPRNAPLFV